MSDDKELFELCKRVYEATGWTGTHHVWHNDTTISPVACGYEEVKHAVHFIPLYSSDYLLGRLPSEQYETLQLIKAKNYWRAGVGQMGSETSDTPLKALLKLTIALHDAGVKL